jgi:hypothetical protein
VRTGRRLLVTVVAAQVIIGGDLVGAQHPVHGEMIFEMRIAQLALHPAEVGEHAVQSRIIDGHRRRSGRAPLPLPAPHAERYRRFLHLIEQRTRAITLIRQCRWLVRNEVAADPIRVPKVFWKTRESGSQLTHCWREMDSNPRSPVKA